jgi:hypothetical protein
MSFEEWWVKYWIPSYSAGFDESFKEVARAAWIASEVNKELNG